MRKLVFAELDRGRAEELLEELEKRARGRERLAAELGERPAEPPAEARNRRDRLDRGERSRSSPTASSPRPRRATGLARVALSRRSSRTAARTRPCASSLLERLRRESGKGATRSKRPRFRVERRTRGERAGDDARPHLVLGRRPDDPRGRDPRGGDRSGALRRRRARRRRRPRREDDGSRGPSEVDELSHLLRQLLVPADFEDVLQSGSFVFEVDRSLARLHWEMQPERDGRRERRVEPLSVVSPFARQLRTSYSPAPTRPTRGDGRTSRARDRRPG